MKDKSLIIGIDSNGKEINIATVENWLENIEQHKSPLANLVYY
ncbi:MAG: hypothetical protein ACOCP4_05730 [Candidatus Woesearchaeota archaeon]